MTESLVVECYRPIGTALAITTCRSGSSSGRLCRHARRNRVGRIDALAELPAQAGTQAIQDFSVSPPGVIGGAVIQAIRKSAGISCRQLARRLGASPRTARSWETGTCPLFLVTYEDLDRLVTALQADARVPCDLAELVLASQCDLLVTSMLHGTEDYAEVPPVDEDSAEGVAARDLLRWAFIGSPPERYSPFALSRPLLAAHDLIAFTAVAHQLAAGSRGGQLASYGRALTAIKIDRPRSQGAPTPARNGVFGTGLSHRPHI
jgi:transcriptional regulator with XRE-family HTH domain